MALLGGYMITTVGYMPLFLSAAALVTAGTFCFLIYFRRPRGVTAPVPAPVGASD